MLHKNELQDTYSHLGYKQTGRRVKILLKAKEHKTATATVERTNGGLIESCDVSVTPGLSPYTVHMEVLELAEFTKQKKNLSK